MWIVWLLGAASVLAVILFAAVMYPAAAMYFQDLPSRHIDLNVATETDSLLPVWQSSARDGLRGASVRTRASCSTDPPGECQPPHFHNTAQQPLQMYM